MKTGRPKPALALTPDEVAPLQRLSTSRSIPHGRGTRVRMLLLFHEGLRHAALAEQLGVTNATVGKWRQRFVEHRLPGLHDERRPGRPRSRTDATIAALLTKTFRAKPMASTQWRCRLMEGATGISKSTVHRVWQAFGL